MFGHDTTTQSGIQTSSVSDVNAGSVIAPSPYSTPVQNNVMTDISAFPSLTQVPTPVTVTPPSTAPMLDSLPVVAPSLDTATPPDVTSTQLSDGIVSTPAPVSTASVYSDPVMSAPSALAPTSDELMTIKKEALTSLSPLIDHLDQKPEERFRTTMMLIQAADDQTLIKAAYEAAKGIDDEKVRAQALLDVVNEINYFTTEHKAA